MISFRIEVKSFVYRDIVYREIRYDGFSSHVETDPQHKYLYKYYHASEGYDMFSTHPPKIINEQAIYQHDII